MERYEADGLVFDVTDAGPSEGEVIVLLHGYPQTRASWADVIPLLADAGYRVLAPDQRGYSPGARPRGRRAYRLDHLADDVLALADAAGATKMHLVGHDWGGAVAWAVAAWHPERLFSVTSLATPHGKALLRSFVSSNQALRSWYMLFYQLPWLPELGMTAGQRWFRNTLRQSGLSDTKIDTYLSVLSEPGAATAAINWYRAMPFLPPSRMRSVHVPTLYLYGSDDFALGRKAADLTGNYVSGPYHYEVLDGVSHWIPEDAPQVVAERVTEHARTYGAHRNQAQR